MTPQQLQARLADARRVLGALALVRALLIGAATGIGMLVVLGLIDAITGLPLTLRRVVVPLGVVSALVIVLRALVLQVIPIRRASAETVALWFEQRVPTLRYALVTAVDEHTAASAQALLPTVASAPLDAAIADAWRTRVTRPLVALLVAAVLLLALPDGALARVTAPVPGDALDRPGVAAAAVADPLATIVVRVQAPAYTGLAERVEEDPSAVRALVGGRVIVEGRGSGVRAILDATVPEAGGAAAPSGPSTLDADQRGDRWRLALPVPREPRGVRLQGAARERVLVIEPVSDSVPAVRLDRPARDTVLREGTGTLALAADLRDDLGLADAAFEYIVSSGSGESFTFRGGRIAARTFDAGTTTGRLEGTFTLDTLKLAPGDLVHLRAVARDRNDVTGPGRGASETRTLRIARADEYDSVSVDPMPPSEPEKNALSQRMILQLTTELRDRERRIGPVQTARESRRLAVEQTKLRKRVGEIVFTRLSEDQGEHAHFAGDGHEHGAEKPLDPDQVLAAAERAASVDPTRALEGEGDETPVVAINKPLLEAYNHMWQASSELETANPARAIPWMERAIEALQRARAAERIYLRGRPARVVVDLAKVRGTGREKGSSSLRTPRAPLDPGRERRLARFDALLGSVTTDPLAATDALLLLRLSLPAEDRVAADALTAAADAVRRGGDVTDALQRARRALAGAPQRTETVGPWGR